MKQFIDDFIKAAAVAGAVASIFYGVQFGMYKVMDWQLQKTQDKYGVEYTVQAARNTFQDNIGGPFDLSLFFGYNLSLMNYVHKHKNLDSN